MPGKCTCIRPSFYHRVRKERRNEKYKATGEQKKLGLATLPCWYNRVLLSVL